MPLTLLQVILDPKTSRKIFELAKDQQEELDDFEDEEEEEDEGDNKNFIVPRTQTADDDDEDDLGDSDDEEYEVEEIVSKSFPCAVSATDDRAL